MATKKFLIEVEEGITECKNCPFNEAPDCNGTNWIERFIGCSKYDFATMKITEHQDWIKVEDRLPEYEETVLVACYIAGSREITMRHRSNRECVQRDENDFAISGDMVITHWAPLPKLKED